MPDAAARAPYLDPRDAGFRADPYPVLRSLREQGPVHWSPVLDGHVVLSHGDVRAVLAGPQMSADRVTPFYRALPSEAQARNEILLRYLGNWLVFRDEPDHTRLRGLIARAFTPAALAEMRPSIAATVAHLLDELAQKAGGAGGRVDLAAEFAGLLPAYVIMDMLGVPRAQLADMKRWSEQIALFIGTAQATPQKNEQARAGAAAMGEAFLALIAERRREPKDDVLTALVAARDRGDRLSDDELVATAILFLFAGHETTASLIAMASLHMMRQPATREQFLQLDGAAQIAAAVEEFLRFDGPTPAMVRIATVPHEIAGARIEAGQRVYAVMASANRDPAQFEDPDAIRLTRSPNAHVTFGFGPHFCLGAPLARMEAALALPALHRRFPAMAQDGEVVWSDGLTLRGPSRLPVRLGPAAR